MDIEDLDCPAEQDQVDAMGQQGCWIAKIGGLTTGQPRAVGWPSIYKVGLEEFLINQESWIGCGIGCDVEIADKHDRQRRVSANLCQYSHLEILYSLGT